VAKASAELPLAFRDYRAEQPVSDEVFEVFRQAYAYDDVPLNARLVSADTTDLWIRERIEMDAGYGGERLGREDYDARAETWAYRARISAVLGERMRAVSQLRRAFDEALDYRPTYLPEHQYRFDFSEMADYAPYQELLRPKG